MNNNNERVYRAAIYNRCSSAEQADALTTQMEQSREIVANKGWALIEQYAELQSGTSGNTNRRTEYKRMLVDMQADKFDILVIKSLDRLMRSAKEWYTFLEILLSNNKQLFIYMDDKFYDTQNGALLAGIQALLNDEFSVALSNKLKERHRIRQKNKTGFNFSRPIYGWTKVSQNEYIINEEQAFYYRQCFQLLREGYGFYIIANMLYKMGARNSLGSKIEASVWRNLCLSPRAYGCVIMNTSQINFHTKKREKVPQEDWVIIEDALPPIVSKQEWEEIQALIGSRKTKDHRTYSGKYKLSHKIVCGLCGKPYHRFKYRKRGDDIQIYWKCASAYRNGRNPGSPDLECASENVCESKLMKLVEETCESYFDGLYEKTDIIIEQCLAMIRKVLEKKSSKQNLERLHKELDKQNQKKDKLYEKLMDGIISDENFRVYSDRLTKEIDNITFQIRLIEVDDKAFIENEKRLMKIKETLTKSDIIDRCKAEQCLNLIDKIVVNGDGTVTIKFDKCRILGLLYMTGFDLGKQESLYEVTVDYDGYVALKRKVARQKEQLIEWIKEKPYWSFTQYANAIECSKNEIASRVRYLMRENRIRRSEDGALVIIE